MRTLQLFALALLATAAHADAVFDITFNRFVTFDGSGGTHDRQEMFSGVLITDGTCTICSISQGGFYSTTVRDGIESIDTSEGFALGDPNFEAAYGSVTFNVQTDILSGTIYDQVFEYVGFGVNLNECPPGYACPSGASAYFFDSQGNIDERGTFVVSPEPSSVLLLGTVLLGIAHAVRRKIIRSA